MAVTRTLGGEQLPQISTRRQDTGRGLDLARLDHSRGPALPTSGRLTILIHGFNNDRARAMGSYHEYVAKLSSQESMSTAELREMVAFLWPGDHSHSRAWSLAHFADSVPVATGAGNQLARFLVGEARRGRQRVWVKIVAHSLGCRVALEAIRAIDEITTTDGAEWVRVTTTVLMAGAVPTFECEPTERFALAAHEAPRTQFALWSERDLALRMFPPGQFRADPRQWPEAIGLYGRPLGRWEDRRASETGWNHGSYWKQPKASARVLRDERREWPPTRHGPTRSDIPEREAPGAGG